MDRNSPILWSPDARGSSNSPFFIYILLVVSLIYGGTTQGPIFFIRAAVICMFAFMVVKDGIYYPAELTLPLISFFGFSIFSFFCSMTASALWPSIQWSANILSVFLFLFLVFHAVREKKFRYGSYLTFLSVIVILELLLQLFQKYIYGVPRPSGTFFNPNFLGGFYSLSGCLFLSLLLFHKRSGLGRKYMFILPLAATLAGILLTGSRGAALSCAAGILVVMMFRFRFRSFLAVACFISILLVVPNPIRDRVLSSADIYRYARIDIYRSALNIFSDHPFGIGLGNLKFYFPQYNFPIYHAVALFGKKAKTVHNEHLQILVELGVFGMVFYLLFLLSLGIRIIFSKKRDNPWIRAGITGALVSLFIHAWVDSVYHTFSLPLNALLLIGCFAAEQDFEWKRIRPGFALKGIGFSACILLLLFCITSVSAYYISSYGNRLMKKEKFDEAIKVLKLSTSLDPLNGNYKESLAAASFKVYLKSGDQDSYHDSRKYIDCAIKTYRRSELLYDKQGFVITHGVNSGIIKDDDLAGAFNEAVLSYKTLLELNPYNVFAMKNLSLLLISNNDIGSAGKLMRKAISTEPNYAHGYFLLGNIREKQGDKEGAALLYKKSLSIYKRYAGDEGLEGYSGMLVTLDKDIIMILKEKAK